MSDELPVEVGQEHTVSVESLAFGGEGVARVQGLVLFVPDVLPGEQARVRVTEVKKSFARADLLNVEQPGAQRTHPPCPLFGTCGGCQLQHIEYEAQVSAKTQMVAEVLERVGKIASPPVAECFPSPLPYGYRNKVELEAFEQPLPEAAPSDEQQTYLALGFHQRDPAQLVEVPFCPISLPEVNALIEAVSGWLNATGWPVYDPESGNGLVREVALRHSVSTRESTVLLTTGRRDMPDKRAWIEELMNGVPGLVGVRHRARTRASQTLRGRPVRELTGRALRFKVGELSFRVSPESFFQVNTSMIDPLLTQIRAQLDPRPEHHLADLYGGVGTFALSLAHEVTKVSLIESDFDATNDAVANIKHNKIDNVEVVRGQVEQRLSALGRKDSPDLVLLDPPRRGCGSAVLRILAQVKPKRIVYLSCDPATLARDLAKLLPEGYELLAVHPFDMFPQTSQIETLATLVRKR